MLKTITLAIGLAITAAISQPAMALNTQSDATPASQQPANNLYAQVVVSFPSAAIKVGSTTVILGQSEHRDSHREERSERRSDREYHRYRESHNDREYHRERDRDRDSDDHH